MGDLLADIGSHAVEGADLVGDHVLQIIRAHVDLAAAKAPQVIESGMGADAAALFLGALDHPAHGVGVAGMEAAGDARRADDLQDAVVVADVIGAEALAHVCVHVHRDAHVFRLSVSNLFRFCTMPRPCVQPCRPSTKLACGNTRLCTQRAMPAAKAHHLCSTRNGHNRRNSRNRRFRR